ncbi:MAG: FkbM family methyltransferase [Thermoguttaceae bacterium]
MQLNARKNAPHVISDFTLPLQDNLSWRSQLHLGIHPDRKSQEEFHDPEHSIGIIMFSNLKSYFRKGVNLLTGQSLPTRIRVQCSTLELGSSGYGTWTVCPDKVVRGGIVYSFGVGEDISWDLAMIERFGVTVHAFDPTPRSAEFVKSQRLPDRFIHHEYGIASWDGTARFCPPENPQWVSHTILEGQTTMSQSIEAPVRRFETIMSSLGHSRVDLIKMDIEGAEYSVIEDLLNGDPVAGGAVQLLIEYHHGRYGKKIGNTKASIRELQKKGFEHFHVSKTEQEWSFLRQA